MSCYWNGTIAGILKAEASGYLANEIVWSIYSWSLVDHRFVGAESRMKKKHQSLFHLMKFAFFSAEVQANRESFLECILEGGSARRIRFRP